MTRALSDILGVGKEAKVSCAHVCLRSRLSAGPVAWRGVAVEYNLDLAKNFKPERQVSLPVVPASWSSAREKTV